MTLPESAIERTAELCGLPAPLLTRNIVQGAGNPRDRRYVAARRVVCMVLRHAGWSFPHIASCLGFRTHTSVLEGIRAAEQGDNDKHLPAPAAELARSIAVDLGILQAEAAA